MVNSNAYQQNALEEFFHFSAIDQDRAREIRKEVREEALTEGRNEGIAQGASERNVEIARNMLQRGFSVADISDITNLSSDEIARLIASTKDSN